MNKTNEQYFYIIDKIEKEYIGSSYPEIKKELQEHKWLFIGKEYNNKTQTHRWQYDLTHTVIIIVENETEQIIDVLL
jgi:hypothetical protein